VDWSAEDGREREDFDEVFVFVLGRDVVDMVTSAGRVRRWKVRTAGCR
jgi:hypothetical protein